jgi:hypothetical protein
MASALLFTIVAALSMTEPLKQSGEFSDAWLIQRFDHGRDVVPVNVIFTILCVCSLILNIFHMFVLLTSLSPLLEAAPDELLTIAVHKYVDGPGKILNSVFCTLVQCVVMLLIMRLYMSYGKLVVFSFIGVMAVLIPLYLFWAIRTWPLFAPTTAVRLGICALSEDVSERAAFITGIHESFTATASDKTALNKNANKMMDVTSALERLASLRKDGMLSDLEFCVAKRRVLENDEKPPGYVLSNNGTMAHGAHVTQDKCPSCTAEPVSSTPKPPPGMRVMALD